MLQHLGRLDARGPHDQLGRDQLAAREHDALGHDRGDARRRAHVHAEIGEHAGGRGGQALGQRGQDAVGRLDDDDADVVLRVDAIEPERDERARRVRQLRREFDAGRARADHRDLQLLGSQRPRLGMRADARVDQPPMEALRLPRVLERDRMLGDPGRAEVVRETADGDDQRVVREHPCAGDLLFAVVDERGDVHDARGAVDVRGLADAIAEVMPVRLREVVGLVHPDVHAAGRDLVQVRLPEVRARLLDQRDVRLLPLAERVAESRREFEAAGAAADDDDPMEAGAVVLVEKAVTGIRHRRRLVERFRRGPRPPAL